MDLNVLQRKMSNERTMVNPSAPCGQQSSYVLFSCRITNAVERRSPRHNRCSDEVITGSSSIDYSTRKQKQEHSIPPDIIPIRDNGVGLSEILFLRNATQYYEMAEAKWERYTYAKKRAPVS